MSGDRYTPGRFVLSVTRLWLPLVIAVAGAVAIVLGHGRTSLAGAGVGLLVIAVIVWMINWMIRLSVESNDDRDREEAARGELHRPWALPPRDQEGGQG